MGKNNENENVYVERQDNTQVRRPVLLKRFQKASPAKQIESYLKIYGVPQQSTLSADTRTPDQKETNRKAGELELYRQKEEEQKQLNRQIALGIGATGAIIGSQFTPAAPYVNAALATHSGINLAEQYHEGTLGFNGETALNTLGLTPYGVKALSYITPKSSKQLSVLSEIKPNVRTRVGDVEVNTPAMTYRQGSKEMADDFLKTGVVNSDGYSNPMFAKGHLWYGIPDEKSLQQGQGISIGKVRLFKRNEEAPKTHLLVSNAPMEAANSKSGFNSIRVGQQRPFPISDKEMKYWIKEGLQDEAINYNNAYYQGTLETPTTIVIGDPVRRIPAFKGAANKENTTLYEFVPGYGYKQVTSQPNTYIWINSKNASMMSDQQWDDAYNAAINAGDYKEVKRLRDLHFQTKSNSTNIDSSGNPIHMYHGSPKTDITEFKHMGSQQGGRGTGEEGFYFTPKYSYAERYKAKHLMKDTNTDEGKIYDTYLNIQKPGYFPQDFPEASVKDFYQMSTPTRIAYEQNGYDGLHLGRMLNNIMGKRPETVVFKNSQIKSARPITYDDRGKIIPLSKRDDFTNPDIRFGWLAPLFGVSAAASLANSKTKNKQ